MKISIQKNLYRKIDMHNDLGGGGYNELRSDLYNGLGGDWILMS